MTKSSAKKTKRNLDLDIRPYPNPIFKNYDYTETVEPGETSPGGGLYHGSMGKFKSVEEFLEKKRSKRRKKAYLEILASISDFKRFEEIMIQVNEAAIVLSDVMSYANDIENQVDIKHIDEVNLDKTIQDSAYHYSDKLSDFVRNVQKIFTLIFNDQKVSNLLNSIMDRILSIGPDFDVEILEREATVIKKETYKLNDILSIDFDKLLYPDSVFEMISEKNKLMEIIFSLHVICLLFRLNIASQFKQIENIIESKFDSEEIDEEDYDEDELEEINRKFLR